GEAVLGNDLATELFELGLEVAASRLGVLDVLVLEQVCGGPAVLDCPRRARRTLDVTTGVRREDEVTQGGGIRHLRVTGTDRHCGDTCRLGVQRALCRQV